MDMESIEAILDRFDAAHPAAWPHQERALDDAGQLRRYVLYGIVLPVLAETHVLLRERGHEALVWTRFGRAGLWATGLHLRPRGDREAGARSSLTFMESRDYIFCRKSVDGPLKVPRTAQETLPQEAIPIAACRHPSQMTEDVERREVTEFVREVLERS
jgi:hypothetical protein